MVFPAKHELGTTLARECESIRINLQTKWLGKAGPTWRPKCVIVLHADRKQYLAAAGQNSLMTAGCSRVTYSGDRIVGRRIDLCGDNADRARSALAHEMSHVVLADCFGRQEMPRWADEGIALLADSANKQARHERDLQQAVAKQAHLPFGELTAKESASSREQAATFYGQSASLVRFLVRRKQPRDFLTFVHRTQDVGYDRAAKEVYGFSDARSLERAWLGDVRQGASKLQAADAASVTATGVEGNARQVR